MKSMSTHERMTCMHEHREADRVPVYDFVWPSTIERWRREGMPETVHYSEYFGLDRLATISADNSPRYPEEVLEATDEWVVKRTNWGQTLRSWTKRGGVPEFLDCRISTPDAWAKAKARMTPDHDRIDWSALQKNYPIWRKDGHWIRASLFFGFDVTHSWVVGTERLLVAMIEDPEWVRDMFAHQLETHLALFEMIWDAGYRFDAIRWCDDMGYRQHQFFSVDTYRELLKPVHRRAAEWAKARGCKVELHSCGDVRPFIPDLIDLGLDMLNPIEVKAGMDPIALKTTYGDRLAFHGGLNAVLYGETERMHAEMRRVIPAMKEHGGYFVGSDHSCPDTVSLDQFRDFVGLAKELGSYR